MSPLHLLDLVKRNTHLFQPQQRAGILRARLVVNDSSEKVYLRALELFEGTIKNYSEISKVNLNGDGIESVEINGGKELAADHYVFAQSPLELLELFPR